MARKKKETKLPDKPLSSHELEAKREGFTLSDSKIVKVENFVKNEDIHEEALGLYEKIRQCFENQEEQADKIEEYWSIYNAIPDENQQYIGNSRCYIPAVRDAIRARTKRTLTQLFPDNNRHVEAIGPTGEQPFAQLSLVEHYIRTTKLKNVVRAVLTSGDVTGQWALYIDWTKSYRTVTDVIEKPVIKENIENGAQVELGDEEPELDLETKEVITEGPDLAPLAVQDLAVYPPTASSIEKATATGVKLRMSKDKIQSLINEGVFILPKGAEDAKDVFDKIAVPSGKERKNPAKSRTEDAGIKTQGTVSFALIYEVHCSLPIGEKGRKVPAYVYFAGPDTILGILKNPFWSGRRPVISASIDEIEGSFYGRSLVEPVKFLQWNLNDFWNMGMDSAQYGLLPVVMTDPLKTPNYQSMVMGLAAVWLADPNSTKPLNFPALYKDAVGLCNAIKTQIWESMDVNDAMMGKSPAGRKNAQAVAVMQQDVQTNIIDHAKRFEEMVLNEVVERFVEMDRQFRDKAITIVSMGDTGNRATVEEIEPQQFESRYFFRWCGTSYMMGMQRMQQMIATMNVLRGIPPQQLGGKRLDISPILAQLVSTVYGPELAPQILVDERNLYTVPADLENQMLWNNIPVPIHQGDNDQEHLLSHAKAAEETGDPTGKYKAHITQHMAAMQAKMQQAMGQQMQKQGGMPGIPGGAGPGVAGTPRPGAQPGIPRGGQQPAGAIHSDQMQDAASMPRG